MIWFWCELRVQVWPTKCFYLRPGVSTLSLQTRTSCISLKQIHQSSPKQFVLSHTLMMRMKTYYDIKLVALCRNSQMTDRWQQWQKQTLDMNRYGSKWQITYHGSGTSSESHWSRRSFKSHLETTTSHNQWWCRHMAAFTSPWMKRVCVFLSCVLYFVVCSCTNFSRGRVF